MSKEKAKTAKPAKSTKATKEATKETKISSESTGKGLVVSAATGKFSFDADIDGMQKAISRVTAAVAAAGSAGVKDFIIACSAGKVYFVGLSTDTFVYVQLAVQVQDKADSAYSVSLEQFSGIIKGRQNINMSFTKNGCAFKALKGSYSGTFTVSAVTEDQIKAINGYGASKGGTASKLTSDLLAMIRNGFQHTAIHDIYDEKSVFTYTVLDSKGTLRVFAADRHHFAHYKCKTESTGSEFKIALPGTHIQLIDKVTDGEDCQFYISDSSLRVKGKGFMLVLPSLQSEEKFFQLVPTMLASLKKEQYKAPVDVARLKLLASNLGALYSNNAVLGFDCTAKSIALSLTTSSGSASESIKCEGTGKAKIVIDPRLFEDITRIMPDGESTLNVIDGKCVHFNVRLKTKTLDFVLSTQKGK